MEDQLLPIDIHYNKLLDWLIDRRHCDPKWHSLVKGIQERISQAQKTLPDTQQLVKIKERETLTYFHCLQVIEELKSTEGEAKNIFGQYTSPRLKEWSEILKLYEKNGTFLAECAQQLIRNVNYEIPALKQQIAKCQQTQRESLRKEGECNANSAALREKYEASCKDMGIAGVAVRQELAYLVSELPALFEQVLAALPNILPAIIYYQSFVHYTTQRMPEESRFLPMLSYVLKEGNVTWYQWKHGEPPNDVIISQPQTQSSLELESESGNADLEIDWGNVVTSDASTGQSDGIDFGESEIDFSADAVDLSVITIEDSGEGGEDESEQQRGESLVPLASDGKVTSDTHETVLGSTQTRNLFLDDLMELREFLSQRQQELNSETTNILLAGQFGSSSDGLEVQSSEAVGEMLGHVTQVLDLLTNSRTQHLFLIKGSPRYLDRLASSLLQQLKLSHRAASQAWNHATRRTEAAAMATSMEPRLAQFISETKTLQTKIAAEISKRYCNRTVNIMGEINQI